MLSLKLPSPLPSLFKLRNKMVQWSSTERKTIILSIQVQFTLRGICVEDSYRIDQDYILTRESLKNYTIELRGMTGNSKLVYYKPESDWRILPLGKKSLNTTYAIYNGTQKFPIGLRDWFAFGICTDNPTKTRSRPLKMSKVRNYLRSWLAYNYF